MEVEEEVPDLANDLADKGAESSRSVGPSVAWLTVGGLFWMFCGAGAQSVLQVVVLAALGRLLEPSHFGLVGAAMVVVSFGTLFSQLGLGPALVQRRSLEPRHVRTAFTVSILFGLVAAGVVVAASPLVAEFFGMAGLVSIVRSLTLVFPVQGCGVVAEYLLRRHLRFRLLARIQVASYALGYGVIGVGMAGLGYGVWALIAGTIFQAIVRSAMLLVAQPHPKRLQVERRSLSELLLYGGGHTVARLANHSAIQGDNLVVGRWLGAEALGVYTRAYQLIVAPASLVGQVLNDVLFPVMSRLQDDSERLRDAYVRSVGLIALVTLPLSTAAFALAPELVLTLLGPRWVQVIAPFRILVLGLLFRTSSKMSDSVARATGAVYRRAWRQGVYAALVVGGAWIGQRWGVTGVAAAVLIALAVNFVVMAQLSLDLTSLSWRGFWAGQIRPALLAVLVGAEAQAAAGFLRRANMPPLIILLFCGVLLGATVFGLLCVAPKAVLGEEGLWLLRVAAARMPVSLHSSLSSRLGSKW